MTIPHQLGVIKGSIKMTQEELLDQFIELPEEAQHQVEDFVAFLRQRYSSTPSPTMPEGKAWMEDEFFGMWRDRNDLNDSAAWVRNLRRSEWSHKDAFSDAR
jgi:hypothetical protein